MPMMRPSRSRWLALVPFVALFWAALVLLLILELGYVPKSAREWALLVLLGPPAYLSIEGLGELLRRRRKSAPVAAPTVSIGRILIGTIIGIVVLAAMLLLVPQLRRLV
jgi:hypothetical protein